MTLLGLRSSKAPGREFRQHDGVVTILMFCYRRASPKHCNDTTEVEYGGRGAPHTAKERSQGSTCVSWGAPLPPYIKEQWGGRPAQPWRANRGVLLPPGV